MRNNTNFYKAALARSLHGSAATQLRWCEIFYDSMNADDVNDCKIEIIITTGQ